MSHGQAPLPVRIAGTAHVAPGEPIPTAAWVTRLSPAPDAADVEARTGIAARHFARPGPNAATELAVRVLADALAAAGLAGDALRRLIYVSSMGGDVLVPANANRVAAALGISRTCDCLDMTNSCMGFLTAFDIAARSVATGLAPVGIVVVEVSHRIIRPDDPRPFLVFGDAAAAAIVDRARGDEGVLASWLRNDGVVAGDVHLTHPIASGQLEKIRFTASNRQMGDDAISYLRAAAEAALADAGLRLADVDWVLPHQPNGTLLEEIMRTLDVPEDRVVRMVHDNGSVGAASIPISLHRLLASGRVRPGHRILMFGVGTGISYGAIIVRAGR